MEILKLKGEIYNTENGKTIDKINKNGQQAKKPIF